MNKQSINLWRAMLRIRRIEEAIAERYPRGEMRCPMHLSIGQEAVAVGVCAALGEEDAVFSGHRAHAHYLARGGDLKRFIAEMFGREDGCCRGRGGSMHLADRTNGFWGSTPIVGGTVPIAVGVAWAARLRGENRLTIVFLGDGCFEEGVVHESMNFAALHRLAILFVCENNGYSVYTGLAERQPVRPIHGIARAHGLSVEAGDGNDVEFVQASTTRAVARARSNGGPQFLEYATYRWREHCGPFYDDNLGYRPAGELIGWELLCPVARQQARLSSAGLLPEVALLEHAITEEIDAAFTAAVAGPIPSYMELREYA